MIVRRLVLLSAARVRLGGGQPRLDAHRRDVQLAAGPPPFVRHQGHRQQFGTPVRHHHGRDPGKTQASSVSYKKINVGFIRTVKGPNLTTFITIKNVVN